MHKAKDNKQIHMFVTGTLIEGKNIEADLFLTAKYMFFPLSKLQNTKDCYCKPAGEYVQAFHVGTYESIGITYVKIKDYLKSHNKKISGNSYEYCIFDNMTSDNPKDYVTEIQIQICDIER